MSGEAWIYLFAVLINAVNLFLQVFFTIMYSDLEWYVGFLFSQTYFSLREDTRCVSTLFSVDVKHPIENLRLTVYSQ